MTINDYSISTNEIFADFNQLLSSFSKTDQPNTSLTSSHPVIKQFRKWLKSKKLSDVSCKNYISDVSQFLNWLTHRNFSAGGHSPTILPQSVEHFTNYSLKLQNDNTPRSTINRKLSSLRNFARFLHQVFALPNFEDDISNIPQDPIENLLKNFRYHLNKKGHKSKTIVNYVSDIKHYLNWATEAENT